MYNVLHIAPCADGGIAMVILNLYKNIDREKIHFDIASTETNVGSIVAQLRELGANVSFIPLKSKGIKAYKSAIEKILKNGDYDAVHVHDSETSFVALYIVKQFGIKKRIAHSHFTCESKLRGLLGSFLSYHLATDVIGCGQVSGEDCFGRRNMKKPNAHVLKNGIYIDRFRFNMATRNEVREKLGLADKFVIGMVGRLVAQKNYPFAIDIIDSLKDKLPDCVLLVAGDGVDRDALTGYVKDCNLENHVTFLGARSDVNLLYMAMDAFMLTSRYEGFPIVGVEALTSGLPILLSDMITKELAFYRNVQYLSLQDIDTWVDALIEIYENNGLDEAEREKAADFMKETGFDAADVAKELEKIYL